MKYLASNSIIPVFIYSMHFFPDGIAAYSFILVTPLDAALQGTMSDLVNLKDTTTARQGNNYGSLNEFKGTTTTTTTTTLEEQQNGDSHRKRQQNQKRRKKKVESMKRGHIR
jgi:hypothetical protein